MGRRSVKAFLRYFYARVHALEEQRMYECYTADCLYYINQVLGVKMRKRYTEILYPAPEDDRPPQEIVDELNARFGLKVVDA